MANSGYWYKFIKDKMKMGRSEAEARERDKALMSMSSQHADAIQKQMLDYQKLLHSANFSPKYQQGSTNTTGMAGYSNHGLRIVMHLKHPEPVPSVHNMNSVNDAIVEGRYSMCESSLYGDKGMTNDIKKVTCQDCLDMHDVWEWDIEDESEKDIPVGDTATNS